MEKLIASMQWNFVWDIYNNKCKSRLQNSKCSVHEAPLLNLNYHNRRQPLQFPICLTNDIDECKEKKVCQCSECSCEDLWGDYECTCSGNLLYMKDHETCIIIHGF